MRDGHIVIAAKTSCRYLFVMFATNALGKSMPSEVAEATPDRGHTAAPLSSPAGLVSSKYSQLVLSSSSNVSSGIVQSLCEVLPGCFTPLSVNRPRLFKPHRPRQTNALRCGGLTIVIVIMTIRYCVKMKSETTTPTCKRMLSDVCHQKAGGQMSAGCTEV